MTFVAAALSGFAVWLLSVPEARSQVDRAVGRALTSDQATAVAQRSHNRMAAAAGFEITTPRLAIRWALVAALSAFATWLFTGSGLFVTPHSSSIRPAAFGAAIGAIGFPLWLGRLRDRRSRALLEELPTAVDTLALSILAGRSVRDALIAYRDTTSGVFAWELHRILKADQDGIAVALQQGATRTAHPEAVRVYELLGHAHTTGGRLASALTDLGRDIRASLQRDITTESGRRALAVYGPILLLMIPVAIVFLMYPTLVGLGSLSNR